VVIPDTGRLLSSGEIDNGRVFEWLSGIELEARYNGNKRKRFYVSDCDGYY
jgi:hypothetical protein